MDDDLPRVLCTGFFKKSNLNDLGLNNFLLGLFIHITTFNWRSRLSSEVLYNIPRHIRIHNVMPSSYITHLQYTNFIPIWNIMEPWLLDRIQLEFLIGIYINTKLKKWHWISKNSGLEISKLKRLRSQNPKKDTCLT